MAVAILSTVAGCAGEPVQPDREWQAALADHRDLAEPSACVTNEVEADPVVNAAFDAVTAGREVTALGPVTTHMIGRAKVASVDVAVYDDVDGVQALVVAGSLSCTLAGCENVPGTAPDNCVRAGCEPNAAKTDCTAATCRGNLCRTSPTCTRTITVSTALAADSAAAEPH